MSKLSRICDGRIPLSLFYSSNGYPPRGGWEARTEMPFPRNYSRLFGGPKV